MGREAGFELNCSGFTGSVTDFIKLLGSLGWSYYDGDNHAEYLPVGDNESFDWQIGEMTESGLYSIFDLKLMRGETVGLVMYYRDSDHGITLLASDTSEITVIPNINRKTITEDDEDSVTDVNWYIERIVRKLLWYDCGLIGFRFEESESEDGEDCDDGDIEDFEENAEEYEVENEESVEMETEINF